MNFVFVILVRSSNNPQNLVTLASSKGASTSSKTQIGEGFTKKTANIRDKAVRACSPPESKVIDCSLFPGEKQTFLILPLVGRLSQLIQF